MITLPVLFIIVYVICVTVFFVMPKSAFNNLVRRDMDKDFDVHNFKGINTKAVGYYKIIIGGAAIAAALITFLLKLIFY